MPEGGQGAASLDASHDGLSRSGRPQPPHKIKEDSMPPRGGSNDAYAEIKGKNKKAKERTPWVTQGTRT